MDAFEDVLMPCFGAAANLDVARDVMIVDAGCLLADPALIGRLALWALMLVAFGLEIHFDSSSSVFCAKAKK